MSRGGRVRVLLREPSALDEAAFLDAVRRSRSLLRPWAAPPSTPAGFRLFLRRLELPSHEARLVVLRGSGELAGVIHLSEIVRGVFQSAYLGYYALLPHAGRGYMTEGLALALRWIFGEMRLHRVEANIQPGNERSLALVRGLGFRREGLSPRYLKIAGRWRDHERWAILAEEWRGRGTRAGRARARAR